MKTVISDSVRQEVSDVMEAMEKLTIEKRARLLGKSYRSDVKLNAFLSKRFDNADTKVLLNEKYFNELITKTEDFGITSIKEKRALCVSILDSETALIVAAKKEEVTRGLVLNDEQKEALAAKLVDYAKFVEIGIKSGARRIGLTLGAIETVAELVEVPA